MKCRIVMLALSAVPMASPMAASEVPAAADSAIRLCQSIEDPVLRTLALEALERNPRIQALAARARGDEKHVASVGGLPDPEARVTAFIEPPETRVGPQRVLASLMQALPVGGERALNKEAAEYRARATRADLEAERLALVTEVRRLYHELAFVAAQESIMETFRAHLLRHEEIARARYTTGRGGTQGALKLQAEISRVDQRLLDLETRRATFSARLSALLDRPAGQIPTEPELGEVRQMAVDLDELEHRAMERNPRIRSADAMLAGADSAIGLAERGFRPQFMVGLTYAWVDRRDDPGGRLDPPPDNGQDVFGIQGGLRIPIWRDQKTAGLEESLERRTVQEHARAQVVTSISAELAERVARIELNWKQLRLLEDLLVLQAEEAVESAQSGYVTGTLNALDLFDAEHLLFDTRTAVARAKADYLVAVAELEGEIAGALEEEPTS